MPERSHGVLAERRAAVLSELVLLFAQGRDPVDLTADAVRLVARATRAAAVFVYLWDEDEERLVLRVGTPGLGHSGVGDLRLRLGEGIAGWTALRQKSVVLGEDPSNDPRHIGIDTIDEAQFHSMLAVPIADESSQLRGVFALYGTVEHAFGDDELAISTEVGRLLATGLARAETNEDLNKQSASARFLVDFPPASRTALVPSLQFAVRRLLDILDSEVCVLEYMSRRDGEATPIMFAFRSGSGEHHVWSTHSRATATANIEQHCAGLEHVSVALGMESSQGILTAYRRRRFRSRDLDRMSTLAVQLSVHLQAVDLNSVASSLATRLLFSQDDDHVGRAAIDLGLAGTSVPIVVRVTATRTPWEVANRSLKESLGTLAGNGNVVLQDSSWALVLIDGASRTLTSMQRQLHATMDRLFEDIGLQATVGVGSLASEPRALRRSIEHAKTALRWAELAHAGTDVRIAAFDEQRAALPLLDVVGSLAPAVVQRVDSLDPLVQYDIEQGSQLVRTLSVLATSGGSVHQTATELIIHRNTLRQRMQRIEQVLGFSLAEATDWVTLALAARVAESRASTAENDA